MTSSLALQTHPKRVGDYVLTGQKIGEGSFGSVFLGYDPQGHRLAVKVVDRAKLTGRNADYLLNEVAALKNCRNEHIVKLFDVKKTKHNFYLFLQYCEGGDLYSYVSRKGRLTEQDALALLFQILRAFRTIVRLGLIHRDLKPENIFLKNGKIKIGDFGLSKQLSSEQLARTYAGSPLNMAPEILKHRSYDNRADIYSMGTVLHFMLYGCSPFSGGNIADLLDSITNGELIKPEGVTVSSQTKKLLNAMLHPDPDSRASWEQLFSLEGKLQRKSSIQLMEGYEATLRRMHLTWIGVLPALANFATYSQECEASSVKQLDIQLAANLLHQLTHNGPSLQAADLCTLPNE